MYPPSFLFFFTVVVLCALEPSRLSNVLMIPMGDVVPEWMALALTRPATSSEDTDQQRLEDECPHASVQSVLCNRLIHVFVFRDKGSF